MYNSPLIIVEKDIEKNDNRTIEMNDHRLVPHPQCYLLKACDGGALAVAGKNICSVNVGRSKRVV